MVKGSDQLKEKYIGVYGNGDSLIMVTLSASAALMWFSHILLPERYGSDPNYTEILV